MNTDRVVKFLSQWLLSAISLLILSLIFKNNIVLGNDKLDASLAAILNSFIITLAYFSLTSHLTTTGFWKNIWSSFGKSGLKVKKEEQLLFLSLFINIIIIWVVKRFALTTGLGISAIFFVLLLAVALTVGQWTITRVLKTTLKKSSL